MFWWWLLVRSSLCSLFFLYFTIYVHVYICVCAFGSPSPNPPLSLPQPLSSFAQLAPLCIFLSLPSLRSRLIGETNRTFRFSLFFFPSHTFCSFSLLLTAESPFYHLAKQQLVAAPFPRAGIKDTSPCPSGIPRGSA